MREEAYISTLDASVSMSMWMPLLPVFLVNTFFSPPRPRPVPSPMSPTETFIRSNSPSPALSLSV